MSVVQHMIVSLSCFIFLASTPASSTPKLDCTVSKQEWMRLRYMSNRMLPASSSPAMAMMTNVDVCPVPSGSVPSCCDRRMEEEMYTLSQQHLAQQLNHWLLVPEQMSNDSITLENLFRSDLDNARDGLNQFFSGIYGYNYKQHRRFFYQFFEDLGAYIIGQQNNLDQLVTNFFSQLRDSIIGLIERSQRNDGFNNNQMGGGRQLSHGTNDDTVEATRRIQCLSERMAQMKPFDDVDVRLKMRVLEAYPPVRMLITSLEVTGRLFSQLVDRIANKPECVLGLVRYEFCALCAGRSVADVCPQSCSQLMTQCFQVNGQNDAQQLHQIWPRLMDAMVHTSIRLERSFNFPAVNRQLKMDISEAITSLQTRYQQSKSKFESECENNTSSGRNAATLFSSSGSSSRLPTQSQQHQPSLNRASSSWPRRQKRAADRSSMASPTLLSWQTRRRQQQPQAAAGPPMMMRQQHPPNNQYPMTYPDQAYAPSMAYPNYGGGQSSSRFGGGMQPSWNMPPPPPDHRQPSVPNVLDRLLQWVAHLKHMYPKWGNLFANPAANFCPQSVYPSSSSVNRTNDSTGCWNPPPSLQRLPTDPGLGETMHLLSLATDRLRQVAHQNGDPETVQLPNYLQQQHQPAPSFAVPNLLNKYVPPYQPNNLAASAGHVSPGVPPYGGHMQPSPAVDSRLNQWGAPPPQPGQFGPYANPQPNPMDIFSAGSGMDPSFWNEPQPNPANQQPPLNYYNHQSELAPPPQLGSNMNPFGGDPYGNNPNAQYPVDGGNLPGSGYQSPYDWNAWPSQQTGEGMVDPLASGLIHETSQTITTVTELTTTAPITQQQYQFVTPMTEPQPTTEKLIPNEIPRSNQSTTPSVHDTTTTHHSSTEETYSTAEPPYEGTSDKHITKPLDKTQLSTIPSTDPVDKLYTSTPVPVPVVQPYPNYGNLPDDEDNQRPPPVFGQDDRIYPPQSAASQSPPPPTFQHQPWPEPQPPNANQAEWWQDPYNQQGSGWPAPDVGFGGLSSSQPPNNGYNQPPVNGPQFPPDQGYQPYEPFPGSGGVPPPYHPDHANPIGGPQIHQPGNQPTIWQDPFYPAPQPYPDPYGGSGMIDMPWNGGSRGNDWQHSNPPPPFWDDNAPLGSGLVQPDPYPLPEAPIDQLPTQLAPPPIETVPQFPPPPQVEPPSNKPTRPVVPHPPPPEVWVPAQLEPGQPPHASSVLLVREYNVQGPFYGPDLIQTRHNKVTKTNTPRTIACLLSSLLFCMPYFI